MASRRPGRRLGWRRLRGRGGPDLRGEPQQCPRGLPYLPGVPTDAL